MGLQSIYEYAHIFCGFFTKHKSYEYTLTASLIVAGGLFLVLFILQGIGIYTMAKRRGMRKKFLAFIPFANLYYIGKLVGECIVCGQRMKRAGLYAMIAEIIGATVLIASILTELYLYTTVGEPILDGFGYPDWSGMGLTGTSYALAKINEICNYVVMIFVLVESIMVLLLMAGLFKKYSPGNYFMLGVIIALIPVARYILIFVLRNRQPVDYEAYIRARREAYMRQQQQYYNTYGRGYSNPYPPNPPQRPKPQEPFSEFGENSQNDGQTSSGNTGEPFEEFSDGLFD